MYYYKQELNTIPGIPFIFTDDTHMTSMKIIQFLRPPPPPPLSNYVQNSSNPLTLIVQFETSPPLLMITNQLKAKT